MKKYLILVMCILVSSMVWGYNGGYVNPGIGSVPAMKYAYSAKYICLNFPPMPPGQPALGPEMKGFYYTDVNVHNPTQNRIVISVKKVVGAKPEDDPKLKPKILDTNYVLGPGEAFQIDCNEIMTKWPLADYTTEWWKGFVVLESNSPLLDVAAVYINKWTEEETIQDEAVNIISRNKILFRIVGPIDPIEPWPEDWPPIDKSLELILPVASETSEVGIPEGEIVDVDSMVRRKIRQMGVPQEIVEQMIIEIIDVDLGIGKGMSMGTGVGRGVGSSIDVEYIKPKLIAPLSYCDYPYCMNIYSSPII